MSIDRNEIEKILQSCERKSVRLFAFRAALRTLPILARKGKADYFWYWPKAERRKHLLSVLLAIDSAVVSMTKVRINLGVPAAAYAAADAARASAYSARASAYSAAYAAASAAAYAADADAAVKNALLADLHLIKNGKLAQDSPLWPEGMPEEIAALHKDFIAALHKVGFGYWAREYECWTRGVINQDRQARRAQLTQEIFDAGPDAVMAFLEADEAGKQLAEARVIFIGDGEVGKTSIIRRLHDEALQPAEPPTPGVFVRESVVTIGTENMRVHYWDFGGQVFLHGTHQLFLRERCVNVIVLNARSVGEMQPVEYWLEHVRVFGGSSPTIIVQNQVDKLAKGMDSEMSFDDNSLRRRYPFIIGCLNLSCKTDEGLAELREALHHALSDSKILDQQTLLSWFTLKELLRDALPQAAHIDEPRFAEFCQQAGIPAESQQRNAALAMMDRLGVALHFPEVDPAWFILDPAWLTGAIYHLLWRADKEEMRGTLTVSMLEIIFDRNRYPDAPAVPADKFPSLLGLLVCFGLAFEHSRGSYRVPMLAPENEPTSLPRPHGESTAFSVKMNALLPSLVFHRYVAKCGQEIVGENLWRNGCLLSHGGAVATLEMLRLEREIRITVWGNADERGRYQSLLRERLQTLLGDDMAYRNLDYTPSFISQGRNYEWRGALTAFLEGDVKCRDMQGGAVSLVELMQAAYGLGQLSMQPVIEELKRMSRDQNDMMLAFLNRPQPEMNVTISPQISVSPQIAVENNQNLSLVAHLKTLVKIKSGIEELEYDLDRQKLTGETFAEARKDIAEIRKLIESFQANKGTDEIAVEERETLAERIKRMGKRVLQTVSSVDNLTSIANNVAQLLDRL